MKDTKRGRPSASFVVGSVALIFLIIGYQAALFITKASVARIVAMSVAPTPVPNAPNAPCVVVCESVMTTISPGCDQP